MGKAYRFYALCSKISAQELHFFNILVGDMSLVGTRPPTLDEWEKSTINMSNLGKKGTNFDDFYKVLGELGVVI